MLVHLTATTGLIGSRVGCLSALARGMAGAVVGDAAVGATVVAAGDTGEATTDTRVMVDEAMLDEDTQVAASEEMGSEAVAGSTAPRAGSTAPRADSTVAAAADSTVVEVVTVVVAADTGDHHLVPNRLIG